MVDCTGSEIEPVFRLMVNYTAWSAKQNSCVVSEWLTTHRLLDSKAVPSLVRKGGCSQYLSAGFVVSQPQATPLASQGRGACLPSRAQAMSICPVICPVLYDMLYQLAQLITMMDKVCLHYTLRPCSIYLFLLISFMKCSKNWSIFWKRASMS